MKIALVTDSSCDLDLKLIKENNIEVIPMRVTYKLGEYRDGLDITAEDVYSRLKEEVPTTSLPSPNDVLNKFQELKDKGYTHIIVVTVSSGLSGTYNMFKMMSNEVEGVVVDVIDSKTLSMALGFIVMEAARLIKNNTPYEDIIKKINMLKTKAKAFYALDTLEYLKKGGRIGIVSSTIGTVLNIKPLISVNEEGKYYTHSKVRGNSQASKKMLETLFSYLEHSKLNVAVLQGMAKERADVLYEKIKSHKNVKSLYINSISPSLVVHTGPGLLGITFCPTE